MSPKELLDGVKESYKDHYKSLNIIKRAIKAIRLGYYPFFDTIEQNFYMSTKRYIL